MKKKTLNIEIGLENKKIQVYLDEIFQDPENYVPQPSISEEEMNAMMEYFESENREYFDQIRMEEEKTFDLPRFITEI